MVYNCTIFFAFKRTHFTLIALKCDSESKQGSRYMHLSHSHMSLCTEYTVPPKDHKFKSLSAFLPLLWLSLIPSNLVLSGWTLIRPFLIAHLPYLSQSISLLFSMQQRGEVIFVPWGRCKYWTMDWCLVRSLAACRCTLVPNNPVWAIQGGQAA